MRRADDLNINLATASEFKSNIAYELDCQLEFSSIEQKGLLVHIKFILFIGVQILQRVE